MKTRRRVNVIGTCAIGGLVALQGASSAVTQTRDVAVLSAEVRNREQAFARSMADRDLAAFRRFLDPEAVFVGPKAVSRGPEEITSEWARYFKDPQPPFSWKPETVEVLPSGALALSSGPVFDPKGARVGTFNSVWRRGPDGAWRVVFDKGCP